MNIGIFKNSLLPWAELRYTKEITNCIKPHTHKMLTIVGIEKGALETFPKSEKQLLLPNRLAIINPDQAHYGKIMDKGSSDAYVLYLDIKWCENLYNFLFASLTIDYIHKNIIEDSTLYANFIQLSQKLLSTTTPLEDKEYGLIEFTSQLFQLVYPDKQTLPTSKVKPIADKIKGFLEQNITNNITIDDISNFIGLSPFYLLNIFKQEYGIPPHAYLLNLKVHKAKELLDRNTSLIDAALEAGFYDQSHFSHAFKKIFSISPKQYQQNRLT